MALAAALASALGRAPVLLVLLLRSAALVLSRRASCCVLKAGVALSRPWCVEPNELRLPRKLPAVWPTQFVTLSRKLPRRLDGEVAVRSLPWMPVGEVVPYIPVPMGVREPRVAIAVAIAVAMPALMPIAVPSSAAQ